MSTINMPTIKCLVSSTINMPTIKSLVRSARPQPLSPLFNRLPTELRLEIYKFVFVGCEVSFDLES